MQIITLNLNGIRSAEKKGIFKWLTLQSAEIVCVQELKAQLSDLSNEMKSPDHYQGYFHCALQKGYSGVGIYCRRQPDKVTKGLGIPEIDKEGRFIQTDFGNLSIISIYMPSGSSGKYRQASKLFFMEKFTPILRSLMASGRQVVLCGDWNIAHKEIDLRNWRANQKSPGFLPEERTWLSHIFDDLGFVDVFRLLNCQYDQYTWWSNRGQAWARNVGWRIDYQIATSVIAQRAYRALIYKTERFSDHAPLIIDYDYTL